MTARGDTRMSLAQHLLELRRRMLRSALAGVGGIVAGFALAPMVWDALRAPIGEIAERHAATLNYDSIAGAFDVRMQIAVVTGIVISAPVWLYQGFAFITPGLRGRERRYSIGFVLVAVPLFGAGCAAGWWVFPHIVDLLASFVPNEDASYLNAKYYLDFALKLMLATGVAFVLPELLVILNLAGILRGRDILGGWRWAILAITVFTAIATPAADVVSMFLLALPLIFLYFGAVVIAMIHDRVVDRREARTLEPVL